MSDNENKPKGDEGATEHVNLKVCGQDGSVVQFKIKKNTENKDEEEFETFFYLFSTCFFLFFVSSSRSS